MYGQKRERNSNSNTEMANAAVCRKMRRSKPFEGIDVSNIIVTGTEEKTSTRLTRAALKQSMTMEVDGVAPTRNVAFKAT